MLFRIAVALTTFTLLHGADKSASDAASAVEAVRNQAPVAAINLCLDNATLCKLAAGKIAGDRIVDDQTAALALPAGAPAPEAVTMTMSGAYPLPPRRQDSVARKEMLDRAGLVRVIKTSI